MDSFGFQLHRPRIAETQIVLCRNVAERRLDQRSQASVFRNPRKVRLWIAQRPELSREQIGQVIGGARHGIPSVSTIAAELMMRNPADFGVSIKIRIPNASVQFWGPSVS